MPDPIAAELAAQPMIDWVNCAPPAELAAELMAAFGPDGPGSKFSVGLAPGDLVGWLFRGYPNPRRHTHPLVGTASSPLHGPMREALQLLEHAELNYISEMESVPSARWRATPVWAWRSSPAGRPLSDSASRIAPACKVAEDPGRIAGQPATGPRQAGDAIVVIPQSPLSTF
jgi:hypothetical protein